MIRVFVESVLRYGLPVNFVVAMYRVSILVCRCIEVVMAHTDVVFFLPAASPR